MNANSALWIVALAVIAVMVVGWLFLRQRRTDALKDRFGDEYARVVENKGGVRPAEAELAERQQKIARLDLRPLSASEHDHFSDEWRQIRTLFVDSPAEAVLRADRMVPKLMEARGFPSAEFEERHAQLTVDHPDIARHYRDGRTLAEKQTSGTASTEDLRRAIQHYEAVFAGLSRQAEAPSDDARAGDTVDLTPAPTRTRVASAPDLPNADFHQAAAKTANDARVAHRDATLGMADDVTVRPEPHPES